MYGIIVEPEFGMTRNDFAKALLERKIDTRTFFCPLNIQPVYQKRNAVRPLRCPEAERLWERGLYLPSGCALTNEQIEIICQAIHDLKRKQ
jgi:perosamine synthetase